MAGGVRERKGSFAAYRGWTHRLKPEDVVTGGSLIVSVKSGSRGTRADRGVCPTWGEHVHAVEALPTLPVRKPAAGRAPLAGGGGLHRG